MPAVRLGDTSIGKPTLLSIVGKLSGDFVVHLGLLAGSRIAQEDDVAVEGVPPYQEDITSGGLVRVYHMAPPLHIGRRTPFGYIPADVLGWVNSLTGSEYAAMHTALHDLETRVSAEPWNQYILSPPYDVPTRDYPAERTRMWRFSCVGLVIYVYNSAAGIKLLDLSNLPSVCYEVVQSVYGKSKAKQLRRDAMFNGGRRTGLHGDAPWRFALPGYVLSSLTRPDETIRSTPYRPSEKDRCFARTSRMAIPGT